MFRFHWMQRNAAISKATELMLAGDTFETALQAILTDPQYCQNHEHFSQKSRQNFMTQVLERYHYTLSERRAVERDLLAKESMNLAEGKTCANCVHIELCKAVFGGKESNTRCQYFPNRFEDSQKGEQVDERHS